MKSKIEVLFFQTIGCVVSVLVAVIARAWWELQDVTGLISIILGILATSLYLQNTSKKNIAGLVAAAIFGWLFATQLIPDVSMSPASELREIANGALGGSEEMCFKCVVSSTGLLVAALFLGTRQE